MLEESLKPIFETKFETKFWVCTSGPYEVDLCKKNHHKCRATNTIRFFSDNRKMLAFIVMCFFLTQSGVIYFLRHINYRDPHRPLSGARVRYSFIVDCYIKHVLTKYSVFIWLGLLVWLLIGFLCFFSVFCNLVCNLVL